MTRLLLVRHGQSTWNAEGRWQGQADPPLSALGEAQAARAARRIGQIPGADTLRAAAASDLQRAQRTAAVLAEALGLASPAALRGLRERAAGVWEGLTHAEIAARWPGSPGGPFRPGGWETDAVLAARAGAALRSLSGDVLVVAHEGLIRALERAAGQELGPFPNLGARWFTGGLQPDSDRLRLAG